MTETEYVLVDEDGEPLPGHDNYEDEAVAADVAAQVATNWLIDASVEAVNVNSAANDNDDNQNTMSYDFIQTGDEQNSTENEQQFNTVGSMWTLGDHSSVSGDEQRDLSDTIEGTLNALDDDIDGDVKAVLQDASNLVQNTRVNQFECPVEACGLGHSHPDHKHDIRAGFNVEDSFAAQMDFCPYCHCGVNELAMLMPYFSYISEPVFTDQHEFEGVLEIAVDIQQDLYRQYNEENRSLRQAIRNVAADFGVSETEVAGHGVRPDLKKFFDRRQQIEQAAEAAPIASETREAIESNREDLQEYLAE